VPAPGDLSEKVVTLLIAVCMSFGFGYIFLYDGVMQIHTVSGLLARCLLGLFFGVPFFLVLRAFLEKAFASQEVVLTDDTLVWSRHTKLWSRRRELRLSEIRDIVADTPTFGEHGVRVIRSTGARPIILKSLSTESANETARELKKSIMR
jgi:hypothetical protein